ncbi:hypothetical protein M758_3G048800 [Ceratodon purpureus]|nr:hypothetical protein M758_3G048800 [Ceratodon purpureus]
MSKDLKFDSMSSVIENYKTAYEEQHHAVEKIRVGLPVEHDTRSTNFVCWRHLELDLEDQSWSECCEAIDEFAGKSRRLWNLWIRSGRGEDPWQLHVRQTKRLLAGRKPSPLKAKRLNSGRSSSAQARSSDPTAEDFENSGHLESLEFEDSRNVNCRFNIQPPSSRESARITLSLEPGEVLHPPKLTKDVKRATGAVLQKEFRFNTSSASARSQSSLGFSKFRRSKKLYKGGSAQSEDAVIRSVKSIKGAIRSLPRGAQNPSVEQPLVVSQCLLGTKYLDGTPGFDGPKACWECLRTVYRTKNEARLLMLKDKLADLRMQGPLVGEAFRVVQDIFQQLVGIGEAITSKLDVYEGTINALTENFDAVVQSVNSQNELQSLKQLADQLTNELPIDTDIIQPVKKKKALIHEKLLAAKRFISPSLKKNMALDAEPHVQYRVPPCNWCGLYGHRMRDCEDLETEIVRRVREYKNQIGMTIPNSSREESESHKQSEADTVDLPSGKFVLWHKNRFKDSMQSKMQEQGTGEGDSSQRQTDSTQLVAGEDMGSLTEADVDQLTTPTEQSASTKTTTKKKMSLVQRRLRTKLMYLLGANNTGPQPKNHGNRRKTHQKKKPCKEFKF